METPTAVDCAYIAGFVDGEGCISIHRNYRTDQGDARPLRYSLRIQISNTDRAVMEWIQERLGGAIFERLPSRDRRMTLYNLNLACGTSYNALCLLLPFLRVKRTEAAICIEFYERFFVPRPSKWPKVTDERRAEMEEYRLRIKALRQKHSSPPS